MPNLEDMDIPDIVYKYRDWKDPNHKTVLTERKVYFAPPSSFEDKLDCKIPIRYDLLTNDEIYQIYLTRSKEDHPERTRQEHRAHARHWLKKRYLRDKVKLAEFEKEYFESYNERLGVLSLTANPDILDMWNKYAKNGTGFIVGYNPEIMFRQFSGGGDVTYLDTLPILKPYPILSYEEQHTYQVYSKQIKWEFEAEYRTHIFNPTPLSKKQRVKEIPADAFVEIIFGPNISNANREDIINSLPEELQNITQKQAKIEDENVIIE